jgi:hypothetical protein
MTRWCWQLHKIANAKNLGVKYDLVFRRKSSGDIKGQSPFENQ